MEEERITKTRVFITGTLTGLLWKKIFRYTVISYNDGLMEQDVVLDFHKEAKNVQIGLYDNMINARDQIKTLKIEEVEVKVTTSGDGAHVFPNEWIGKTAVVTPK